MTSPSPTADDGEMQLLIETAGGDYVRTVLPASLLPVGEVGSAAEAATRSAASTFGLPDFVFRPAVRATSSGTREVGDALLIVGEMAAVVQIKARKTPSSDPQRERSWLDSRILKASRQANGTIRSMREQHVDLTNERGRVIRVDGSTMNWVSAIVVDHSQIPEGYVPRNAEPSVALLRRDWEFLFGQLKSTDAVVRYLARVSSMPTRRLGDEPVRYYELAAADAAAPPGPADTRLLSLGGVESRSTPLLPQAPAGSDDRAHIILRMMLEDIATAPRTNGFDEVAMLEVLAAIDTLAVALRSELGITLLAWLVEAAEASPEDLRWRIRTVKYPDRPNLLFAAASRWSAQAQVAFNGLVEIRHQQMYEVLDRDDGLMTVGVLLTPRHDGPRLWDTTMAATRGDLQLDDSYRQQLEELWPRTGTEAKRRDGRIDN